MLFINDIITIPHPIPKIEEVSKTNQCYKTFNIIGKMFLLNQVSRNPNSNIKTLPENIGEILENTKTGPWLRYWPNRSSKNKSGNPTRIRKTIYGIMKTEKSWNLFYISKIVGQYSVLYHIKYKI